MRERERNNTATWLRLARSRPKSVGQAEAAYPGAAGSPRLLPFSPPPSLGLLSAACLCHRLTHTGVNQVALRFPASPCFPLCLFSCEYIWKHIGGGWVALTLQKEECGKGTVFSTLSD